MVKCCHGYKLGWHRRDDSTRKYKWRGCRDGFAVWRLVCLESALVRLCELPPYIILWTIFFTSIYPIKNDSDLCFQYIFCDSYYLCIWFTKPTSEPNLLRLVKTMYRLPQSARESSGFWLRGVDEEEIIALFPSASLSAREELPDFFYRPGAWVVRSAS